MRVLSVFFFFLISNRFRIYTRSLPKVEEHNTLFVHALLFRYVKSSMRLPALLEAAYVEMPEIKNIVMIQRPGTKFCKTVVAVSSGQCKSIARFIGAETCWPFSTLSAKNAISDAKIGYPEILYHHRATSIDTVYLRPTEYVI